MLEYKQKGSIKSGEFKPKKLLLLKNKKMPDNYWLSLLKRSKYESQNHKNYFSWTQLMYTYIFHGRLTKLQNINFMKNFMA